MDDATAEASSDGTAHGSPQDDPRSPWDRALDGPPINPRSELIYHDDKPLRARHRS